MIPKKNPKILSIEPIPEYETTLLIALLIKRIKKRVNQMFKNGAVLEVKKFNRLKVKKDNSSKKVIGIDEISKLLNGEINLIEAKERVFIKTRQYAKRQFTWARGHMKSWEMIYSSDLNDLLRKAINKICLLYTSDAAEE